jgi:hypothetical protein
MCRETALRELYRVSMRVAKVAIEISQFRKSLQSKAPIWTRKQRMLVCQWSDYLHTRKSAWTPPSSVCKVSSTRNGSFLDCHVSECINWGFQHYSRLYRWKNTNTPIQENKPWVRLVITVLNRPSVRSRVTRPSELNTFWTLSRSHLALNSVTNGPKIEIFALEYHCVAKSPVI